MEYCFFPILKKTVRIKKMDSFCWIVNLNSDNGINIHPFEAFILSLCCGKYDLKTIEKIFSGTFIDTVWKNSISVKDTLQKLDKYVEWGNMARPEPQRYDPYMFLYNVKTTELSRSGRFDTPGEISLILTHRCNFRCIYCFNDSGRNENQLSTGEWLDVIDQAKELNTVKVTISGGEPLIHPGFKTIIDRILENDMLAYICTNGSYIDDKMINYFLAKKIPCIQVSLESVSEKMHDEITAVPGNFFKVINAIKRLVASGIKVFIKAVIIPANVNELEKLIDLCYSLGVTKLVLDRFDLSNAGRGDVSLFISREQELAVEEIVKRKNIEFNGGMEISAVTMCRCWSTNEDVIFCGAFLHSMTILPTGDISVCEKLINVPEMIAGNIKEKSLSDIWTSERVNGILMPPPEKIDTICRECELLKGCRTGCYAQTLFVSDNPYAPDPRCWKSAYERNPYVTGYVTSRKGIADECLTK